MHPKHRSHFNIQHRSTLNTNLLPEPEKQKSLISQITLIVRGAFLCDIWPFLGAPNYTEQKWGLATGPQINTHPAETYHNTTSQTSTRLTCPLSVSTLDAQWEASTPIDQHQNATQISHKFQRYTSPLGFLLQKLGNHTQTCRRGAVHSTAFTRSLAWFLW